MFVSSFLDIVQDKVKRVTILSMNSFQMHISLLLSLGMVTQTLQALALALALPFKASKW